MSQKISRENKNPTHHTVVRKSIDTPSPIPDFIKIEFVKMVIVKLFLLV